MNSKIKKLFPLCFLLFISVLDMKAGFNAPVIRYSPSNPIVGQTVTFTVTDYRLSSETANIVCEITNAKIAPDLGNNSALRLDIPSNTFSVTHVYNSSGTFQIGYDYSGGCGGLGLRSNKQGSRALENFQFGPVGGDLVESGQGSNGVFAPLLIAAAPPSSIPTMGEWGLIILGLISTIFGVIMINQKYFIPA